MTHRKEVRFYSKRNQVYPVLFHGNAAVEKRFLELESWIREQTLYTMLADQLPLPRVLESAPGLLVTEYLPFPHFSEVLERQETGGFDPAPWNSLLRWLKQCQHLCGKLPEDVNLRDFLWDEEHRRAIGLDLEAYRSVSLSEFGAVLAVRLLEDTPNGIAAKRAAALIVQSLQSTEGQFIAARRSLSVRRTEDGPVSVSGIVLAGGLSSRMGQRKLLLPLLGTTLLEWQVNKLKALGIQDILISGPPDLEVPCTRTIPDKFPCRGPLGGLHACLKAARHSCCLVLGGDVPLVPPQVLAQMIRSHQGGATLLTHQGKWEPLIAVYDSALSESIPPLLMAGGAPVKKLLNQINVEYFPYSGPEHFLLNCNTPDDYEKICRCAEQYQKAGICLQS